MNGSTYKLYIDNQKVEVVVFSYCVDIPDGSKHYYYGNYCKVARYPAEKRQLSPEFLESLDSLDQEERQTVRRSRAKELGFKGTTVLHRFHSLYGFDLTRDFVIDAQHGLPLGVVKHDFHLTFDETDELDQDSHQKSKILSERLSSFPWTAGIRQLLLTIMCY